MQSGMFVYNSEPKSLNKIPVFTLAEFRSRIIASVRQKARIVSLFGQPVSGGELRLCAVLAYDRQSKLEMFCADVGASYAALTPECEQTHWFEREIFEQWGVVPEGHPWLKPIRFQAPYLKRNDRAPSKNTIGVTNYFTVRGQEAHDVAVGPVHAGVIEPGHFRFQCHGEQVFHLEISLGYQHRGVEKALQEGINKRTIHYMETLAGDTTIGHALAYCQAYEALSRCTVSSRAHAIRGIMLELERLANHTGDLGALANDVAYLPTASFCGRLRGDFLNMSALVCGNRFGRGMLIPGGVNFDIDDALQSELMKRLESTFRDVANAVGLLWTTSSVVDRFEGTGLIRPEVAETLGLVGPAARASGIERDVRFDFPCGIYRLAYIPMASYPDGDVFARAYVRWVEIQRSVAFIKQQLHSLAEGEIRTIPGDILPEQGVVSLVEGWRGEICHTAMTDAEGKIARYKIVDPSFHNWMGLAMALRGEEISNFPLCNKSFNLSYCGHDL